MSNTTTLVSTADQVVVPPHQLREAINAVVAPTLRPAAGGLALLYFVFAASHLLLLPPLARSVMAPLAASTMVILAALSYRLSRAPLLPRYAHPIAAGICGLVLVNSLAHMVVLGELKHSTNVALLLIGIGGLVLSVRWFAALLLSALFSWILAALALPSSPDVVHFAFMIFGATVLSTLLHTLRLSVVRQLKVAHLVDAQRQVELERALSLVQQNEVVLRQAKDAAETAARAKSAFLSMMSHELRTPLSVILGYASLLQVTIAEGDLQQIRHDIDHITLAGNHLLTLINSVLDYSKIEAGKMPLAIQTVAMPMLIDEITAVVQPLIAQRHNALEVVCAPEIDSLQTDPTKLRQILLNLLSNAAKFTEHGQISLEVYVAPPEPGQREPSLILRVGDTGIGISEDKLPHLFKEFTQVGETTSGGTGLGLALSLRLCQMLEGDIRVDSQPGRGSLFTVRLPYRLALVASA